MAFASRTAYHADSDADADADDEYERSVITSPTQLHDESDNSPTDSEPPSNEHTPTFGNTGEDQTSPRTIITAWTAEESAQFISSLGLRQYCDAFIENDIVGEALVALKHDELKEMGIASVGHRLIVLKSVYDTKVSQDIPLDPDHYIPLSAEQNPQLENATKEDVSRLARSIIRLRDERITHLEAQLTRLADDYRKLRQELLPVFKMAKERSEPLPYAPYQASTISPDLHQQDITSPPITQTVPEPPKSSLTRTFSKKLFLGSTPKNNSPTHLPNTIHEGRSVADGSSLDPSAAATSASNQLTASMSGGSLPGASPNNITVPSPTSPNPYQYTALATRSYRDGGLTPSLGFPRHDGSDDAPRPVPTPTPPNARDYDGPPSGNSFKSSSTKVNPTNSTISTASTLLPGSSHNSLTQSAPPSAAGGQQQSATSNTGSSGEAPSVEIFKSFRVGLEDPCYKVLPAALRKYNIQADWRQYALYIVYGDQERCVGLEEKPLALFKDLDRDGKKPMFMLRRLQGSGDPMSGGLKPPGVGGGGGMGGGVMSSAASVRTMQGPGGNLPGGVL